MLIGLRGRRARATRRPAFATATCLCLAVAVTACGGAAKSIHLVTVAPPVPSASTASVTTPADPSSSNAGGTLPPASAGTNGATGEAVPSSLSASRAVGQMLMTHVTGLTASRRLLARIRTGQVGSVILYRPNISNNHQLAHLTGSIQQAARAGGNPPVFIGTDQEGGSVKRLYNAPPTMSAQAMGASSDPLSVAESQGRATGTHLRRLGINLDFAPVSDIPTTGDNFLQDRAFGHNQRSVVQGATGFAIGLSEAQVAASAKHFPGLGAAGPRDTDFTLVTINASKSQLRASYAPYKSMAQSGSLVAPLVMISDAIYPSLDPSGLPAVLSRNIVSGELAAAEMGDRVTITDDLEVPSVRQYSNAAVKAVLAGDDILMFAQHEGSSEQAYRSIRAAVASHTIPESVVLNAANRVIQLKQELAIG
jgi:beta-N-acetylhexosaminidase